MDLRELYVPMKGGFLLDISPWIRGAQLLYHLLPSGLLRGSFSSSSHRECGIFISMVICVVIAHR